MNDDMAELMLCIETGSNVVALLIGEQHYRTVFEGNKNAST
jgi:predicted lactoylglutathione lyase